ncbi:tryptophan--tRNA ligase domain protein, partial [Teladorsagia circumcincta]
DKCEESLKRLQSTTSKEREKHTQHGCGREINVRGHQGSRFSRGVVPVGLLTYPILQAADVLMFKATHVPVGADQAQHMNLLADLADHFNSYYKISYFPRPKQVIQPATSRLRSLRDPLKKMSKSEKSARSRLE